jgi:hypothetical protein
LKRKRVNVIAILLSQDSLLLTPQYNDNNNNNTTLSLSKTNLIKTTIIDETGKMSLLILTTPEMPINIAMFKPGNEYIFRNVYVDIYLKSLTLRCDSQSTILPSKTPLINVSLLQPNNINTTNYSDISISSLNIHSI